MPGEPFSWNVIVVGGWNTAILTPDGIRKRLFRLPEGTPVDVEISIDRPGLLRVIHDGLVVTPTSRALEVAPQRLNTRTLQKAAEMGRKALLSLPETPAASAGVNIRYQFASLPDDLLEFTKAPLDELLSDESYRIEESVTKRSLAHGPGVVNVEVSHVSDGGGTVTMNFHRSSVVHAELDSWLSGVSDFVSLSKELLRIMKADVEAQEEPSEG